MTKIVYGHGPESRTWKGGQIIDSQGRVMIFSPDHPHPQKGHYVYRYRLVVEHALGRHLDSKESVHHKNGIVNDDRLENLEVMNWADHNRLHAQQLRLNGRWSVNYDKCQQCGGTEAKHKGNGLCTRCCDKNRWPRRNKSNEHS